MIERDGSDPSAQRAQQGAEIGNARIDKCDLFDRECRAFIHQMCLAFLLIGFSPVRTEIRRPGMLCGARELPRHSHMCIENNFM